MNRLLRSCLVVSGLLLFGCSRQPQDSVTSKDQAARQQSAKNTTRSNLPPQTARTPTTGGSSIPVPDVAYYRDNFERLFASGELNSLERYPEVLKNPEIGRLLVEKLQAERHAGRFWNLGASLLGETRNKSFAPLLWAEWKNFSAFEPPTTPGWDVERETFHPKSALVHAVFRIGDIETITAIWQSFPAFAEGDQLVVAKAASGVLDPVAAVEVMRVFDSAKSERVRVELVNSVNRMLYFTFTGGSEADRRWARQVAEPLLVDLQKRGLVRDFLAKIITP